jgi:WD40 repeat protein
MLLASAVALVTTQVKTLPANKTFVFISAILCLHGTAIARKIRHLKGRTWAVHGVTFSPDDRTLASEIGDGTVSIWQVR